MPRKREYTTETLERALIHHGVDYQMSAGTRLAPEPLGGPNGHRPATFLITTGIGQKRMTLAETYAYVIGLADAKRKADQKFSTFIASFDTAPDDTHDEIAGGILPVDDWRYEVDNGDTVLGYAEWRAHKIEADNN